jgi:hypothetical protein
LQEVLPKGKIVLDEIAEARKKLEDFKTRVRKLHGDDRQLFTLPIENEPSYRLVTEIVPNYF